MENWKTLLKLDKKLQKETEKLFNAGKISPQEPLRFLSGSSVEIGMVCRSIGKTRFELEYDEMWKIGFLTKEMGTKYLAEVPGNPGYYELRKSQTAEYFLPLYRGRLDYLFKGYLCQTFDTSQLKAAWKVIGDKRFATSTTGKGPSHASEYQLFEAVHYYLKDSPILYAFISTKSGLLSTDKVLCLTLDYVTLH